MNNNALNLCGKLNNINQNLAKHLRLVAEEEAHLGT